MPYSSSTEHPSHMLKKSLYTSVAWAIAASLLSLGGIGSAQAALFDQEEVEADRFVAIAVPLPQGDRYNLIVLEQKSDARPCWQEDPETGKIDPLLLTFDFSGICGRSTDSNGYSIRQVGEDLALKYRLSVRQKEGVLTLMGIPLESAFGKPMEIGRAQSQGDDSFLKISLNPDWKLTRRSYQGKALGHIYFTRDVIPPEPEETLIEETSVDVIDITTDTTTDVTDIETEDLKVPQTIETDPEAQTQAPLDPASPFVQPLQGPIQIPVPTPQSNRGSLNAVRPVADVNLDPIAPIPVPAIAPLGRIGASEPDVFSPRDLARLPSLGSVDVGSPPPPAFKVALSIRRYRVFVTPENAQSEVIDALAPDAFWTSQGGRRMLQVGSFLKQEKADTMMQALAQQGINATIDASQY